MESSVWSNLEYSSADVGGTGVADIVQQQTDYPMENLDEAREEGDDEEFRVRENLFEERHFLRGSQFG